MYKQPTSISFFLSLAIFLILPSLHVFKTQHIKLLCFAPYLAASAYSHSKPQVLLKSMFIGFLYDCFSSAAFGIYALLYVLSCSMTYNLKNVFLEEKLFSVPLITTIFSLVFSLLSYPVFSLFHFHVFSQKQLVFDVKNALTVDFCYAIIIYVIPCLISKGSRRILSLIRRFL
ncbi:rod shape-determining protein MreD [Chlamydiifrater volucris]|uniref:rod shape-determining protein MreD n=1 Tax=Chlamydiifrater volucris TaxID=2681470 RepID=UPI001BD0A1E0